MSEQPTKTPDKAPNVELARVVWRIDSAPYERTEEGTDKKVWVARYVPYVTAAICADLLDQWVGPFNWHDEYTQTAISGVDVVVCRLSVREPGTDEWVEKQDVGVSPGGNLEMQAKGTVSDAFKRAASLKFGVARNVYLMPSLWAACRVKTTAQGKPQAYEHKDAEGQLLEQLEARGWEWDGKLVLGPEETV